MDEQIRDAVLAGNDRLANLEAAAGLLQFLLTANVVASTMCWAALAWLLVLYSKNSSRFW